MRYMMLIYSKPEPGRVPSESDINRHWELMDEAARKGAFVAAEPLAPASSATALRVENGKALITDGPFVETKEQLGGYYIFECANLDEAIEWASKIPAPCCGPGGIEIRPMPGLPARVGANKTHGEIEALT